MESNGVNDDGDGGREKNTLTDAAPADRAGFGHQVGITLGLAFVVGGMFLRGSWPARAEDGAVGGGVGRGADAIGVDGSGHEERCEEKLHLGVRLRWAGGGEGTSISRARQFKHM